MPKKSKAASLENIFVSEAHRIIYSEISYLKKRIHLVEGERKANFESNEECLKTYDNLIKELKDQNHQLSQKRSKVSAAKEKFLDELTRKLGSHKRTLEYRDMKFSDLKETFDCKIGTLRNKQNYLKFKKSKADDKLQETILEEQVISATLQGKAVAVGHNTHVKKRLNSIKKTETATAAMTMKITEADNIRSRYKAMQTMVKAENISLTEKCSDFEKKLQSEKQEMQRITTIVQDSQRAKKQAKIKLSEVEDITIKEYSEREQTLYEARLKLKTIHDRMESIGSKLSFPKFHMIHRDSSVTEGLQVGERIAEDMRESGKTKSVVETVFTELSNMTGESDPNLIVTRFQEQRKHSKELVVQEDIAKSAVRKVKLRKRFLEDKLTQLQYSGGLKRENLNTIYEQIFEEMEVTATERQNLTQWLEEHFSAMEQMETKLQEICNNNGIAIPTTVKSESESPVEKVYGMLQVVHRHLEKLLGGSEGPLGSTPALLSPIIAAVAPLPGAIAPIFPGTTELTPTGLPQEINADATMSVFNLPSPIGSSVSQRVGGSFSDVEGLGIDSGEKLPSYDLEPFGDRPQSLSLTSGGQDAEHGVLMPDATTGQPLEMAEAMKVKTTAMRRDSSEEEEAVTRNVVKRQSQILYEAKTRKGRFTSGGSAALQASAAARKKY